MDLRTAMSNPIKPGVAVGVGVALALVIGGIAWAVSSSGQTTTGGPIPPNPPQPPTPVPPVPPQPAGQGTVWISTRTIKPGDHVRMSFDQAAVDMVLASQGLPGGLQGLRELFGKPPLSLFLAAANVKGYSPGQFRDADWPKDDKQTKTEYSIDFNYRGIIPIDLDNIPVFQASAVRAWTEQTTSGAFQQGPRGVGAWYPQTTTGGGGMTCDYECFHDNSCQCSRCVYVCRDARGSRV